MAKFSAALRHNRKSRNDLQVKALNVCARVESASRSHTPLKPKSQGSQINENNAGVLKNCNDRVNAAPSVIQLERPLSWRSKPKGIRGGVENLRSNGLWCPLVASSHTMRVGMQTALELYETAGRRERVVSFRPPAGRIVESLFHVAAPGHLLTSS